MYYCTLKLFVNDSDATHWSIPAVFSWLQKEGGLSEEEMTRTFNCGLGAVLVVAPPDAQRVLRQLQAHEEAWIVGSLAHKQPGETLSDIYMEYSTLMLLLEIKTSVCAHAGAEAVVVRNLKHSLLNGGPASSGENGGCHGNSSTPHKRTRVAVLISGSGGFLFILEY